MTSSPTRLIGWSTFSIETRSVVSTAAATSGAWPRRRRCTWGGCAGTTAAVAAARRLRARRPGLGGAPVPTPEARRPGFVARVAQGLFLGVRQRRVFVKPPARAERRDLDFSRRATWKVNKVQRVVCRCWVTILNRRRPPRGGVTGVEGLDGCRVGDFRRTGPPGCRQLAGRAGADQQLSMRTSFLSGGGGAGAAAAAGTARSAAGRGDGGRRFAIPRSRGC